MQILFTTLAVNDLKELRQYLNEKSQIGLKNVVADIKTTIITIPSSISKGRTTPHDEVFEMISPKYKYLIPYYMRKNNLYILRIYHPNRKPLNYKTIIKLD